MFRLKTAHLVLALGMITPLYASAANFCIATSGGFGKGGTTFIGFDFKAPAANACAPWSGFTKTASTVVLITTGVVCMSSDDKVLQLSLVSADPDFEGPGVTKSDFIKMCTTNGACPVSPSDQGEFGGTVTVQKCTAALNALPPSHD